MYLEKACEWLHSPDTQSACKEMIDSYFPVILDMIKGQVVGGSHGAQQAGLGWGVGGGATSGMLLVTRSAFVL